MKVSYSGDLTTALVDLAHPEDGIQAVVVDTDMVLASRVESVACASCWEPLSDRPRRHGAPAYRAAVTITDEAAWPRASEWETADMHTRHRGTRLEQLVYADDVARGAEEPWEPFRTNTLWPDPPGGGQHGDHATTGHHVDHPASGEDASVEDAVEALRRAHGGVDAARARLVAALRAEHGAGVSANRLSEKAAGTMSRPVVLEALAGHREPRQHQ